MRFGHILTEGMSSIFVDRSLMDFEPSRLPCISAITCAQEYFVYWIWSLFLAIHNKQYCI